MNAALHTVTLNPALDQTVTLDELRAGGVNLARAAQLNAGGKGVNVASCLADWGHPATVHGLLGQANSRPFEQLFAAKRLPDRMLRLPGDNRVNIKLADLKSGLTTDINLPGLQAAETDLRALAASLAGLGASDCVALAGSLPPGLPPDSLARLCSQLKRQGAWVLLDSSGPALAAALANPPAALPDCVKPNREELEQWAGRPLATLTEIAHCAQDLQRQGIARVVVSLGEQGALLADSDGARLASLPPQRPLSTVGAGDALVAGLMAARQQRLSGDDSLRLAVAFAAAKLQCVGPHLPEPQLIRRLAGEVRLQTLAAA
ncbi:1-phosphofructokinase [Chromobacterium sphagni]|uniref:Phosphofructokinase n=1 Tax=Chromobacterium sphagni TaxID=1903179 RepID=A0A1S1WVW2_9NEIS|nr:1-phosphofructokinase [Chromobacterium sphagni]OHX11401.1 1-phosphofructokinase [Chromobacterium sphagni]